MFGKPLIIGLWRTGTLSLLKPPRFLVVVLLLGESPQSGSIAVAEANPSSEKCHTKAILQ